ncbi:hypothetical protein C0989_009441 [Termitomyces sp. Mn162]|nr:hypothetical protein C0989_009441 [Termitomyces sp. Mn162]
MSASEDGSFLSDIDAQGLQKLGYKPALPRLDHSLRSFTIQCALARRDLFCLSHFRWSLLLVLSPRVTQISSRLVLDQWVALYRRNLDREPCGSFRATFFIFHRVMNLTYLQATAQLLIAGVAIFHPEWVVTPWQTCVYRPISRTE